MLIFGKHASGANLSARKRAAALKVLEGGDDCLPETTILRCRVRYFTDGAILGSAEFVRGFSGILQAERKRKYTLRVNNLKGADWGDLAVIQGLRTRVFS